ncbi:MAG: DegV family protein [Candidatus Izimaplasma sp.]|nr:DegV family protein [Candidatus Izimaplasma bacterium]
MNKIKLISDSTCDLSKELIEKYDIEIIPLYVNFKSKSYLDGKDLTVAEMYDLVSKTNELPKTAAPSPGIFFETFKKYLDEGYEIIYTGIGSKFSASFNSAKIASEMLESENIYLVDSLNLSSGSGLLLLKAGEMIKSEMIASEIKIKMEELVPKVRSQFVIKTLEYLYKGGRLNGLSALFGSFLRVKPIIKVRDGLMAVGKKGRGNVKNAINIMVKDMLNEKENIDNEFMMITHSMAKEDTDYIKEKIESKVNISNLYETSAGCVISSHCGKGTIGILYILK